MTEHHNYTACKRQCLECPFCTREAQAECSGPECHHTLVVEAAEPATRETCKALGCEPGWWDHDCPIHGWSANSEEEIR